MRYKFIGGLALITIILVLTYCNRHDLTFPGQNSPTVLIDMQTIIGFENYDENCSVIKSHDAGYIVLGSSTVYESNIIMTKINEDFEIEWQRQFGGSDYDYARDIIRTSDGGYLIAGYTKSTDGDVDSLWGKYDIWLLKTDIDGYLQWAKCYGGTENDFVGYNSIIESPAGGYLFYGTTESVNGDVTKSRGKIDTWLVYIDDNGNIEWESSYGGGEDDFAFAIKNSGDGNYYISCITSSINGDIGYYYKENDVWVAKINILDSVLWRNNFGGTSFENHVVIEVTADNGLIVCASSDSKDGQVPDNYGRLDLFLFKLASDGEISWREVYGGRKDDIPCEMIGTSDGGYLISARTWSDDYYVGMNKGKEDIWLIKINEGGAISWTKVFGGSESESAYSLLESDPGRYITGSTTLSHDGDINALYSGTDQWIFRINE